MPALQHPMLPYLVDLESPFDPTAEREYDPVDLVRYALFWPGADYWPDLALSWLEQGVPSIGCAKNSVPSKASLIALRPSVIEHAD